MSHDQSYSVIALVPLVLHSRDLPDHVTLLQHARTTAHTTLNTTYSDCLSILSELVTDLEVTEDMSSASGILEDISRILWP